MWVRLPPRALDGTSRAIRRRRSGSSGSARTILGRVDSVTGFRRVAGVVAGVLAAVSAVNVATSVLPGGPVFGMAFTFGLFAFSMAVVAGVIVWMTRRSSRGGASRADVNEALAEQWRGLPLGSRIALTVP